MLGAEAEVTQGTYNGIECAIKKRLPKSYRHPEIDRHLSTHRLSNEVKILKRLRLIGVDVPKIYQVTKESLSIYMEWVSGPTCKDFLQNSPKPILLEFAHILSKIIAKIHSINIIHGDLTTCNIICRQLSDDPELPLDKRISPSIIDFGLSYSSTSVEDKAVDLYVFEKCVICSLSDFATEWLKAFYSNYSKNTPKGDTIISRLNSVRLRGRKRSMAG